MNKVIYGLGEIMVITNYGDGTTTQSDVPKKITNIKFKEVSAGSNHSMALDVNGYIYSWGSNDSNCCGTGAVNVPPKITSPTKVSENTYKAISAGNDCSFAIDTEGYLWVWGNNQEYKLRRWNRCKNYKTNQNWN